MAESKHRQILRNVVITIGERSTGKEPADPPEGQAVIWVSDGTGDGDDGDLIVKTTAGGSTKSHILNDFSATGL